MRDTNSDRAIVGIISNFNPLRGSFPLLLFSACLYVVMRSWCTPSTPDKGLESGGRVGRITLPLLSTFLRRRVRMMGRHLTVGCSVWRSMQSWSGGVKERSCCSWNCASRDELSACLRSCPKSRRVPFRQWWMA